MTQINLDEVYLRFQTVAETFIGPQMAEVSDGAGGSVPAIFRQKDPRRSAKYPFTTVNISNVDGQSVAMWESYDETGERETWSLYNLLVTYTVYSTDSTTHNSQQLAFDLKSKFARVDVHELFNVDGLGEVTRVDPVNMNNFKRDDEVGEASSFNILFTALHIETNTDYDMTQVLSTLRERFLGSDQDIVTIELDVDLTET